ncbi:DUF4859 domain-containing protein [Mariniflexile soesokkakense]|uniref:DUF4859 domain-containing protein n=1 Tax=Mariniflexile soesokkakense TaxID=1343160 RepID=A0ABV0ABR7_9FLAO
MKNKLLFLPFFKWTFLLTLFISTSQVFAQVEETITYNIQQLPTSDYSATNVPLDVEAISTFFGITTTEFSSLFGTEIVYGAIEPDGNFNTASTANTPGHWFTTDGYTIGWGDGAYVYSEKNAPNFSFNVGQFPDRSAVDDMYTTKQAFTYTPSGGGDVKRYVFVINLTIVATLSTYNVSKVNSIRIWKNDNHLFVNKLPINSTIKIYDILGKTLFNEKIQGDSFDVALSSGIKIIRINDSFVKKISL